jgi:hypothetical protein
LVDLGRDGAVATATYLQSAAAATVDLGVPVILGSTKIYFTPSGGTEVLAAQGSGASTVVAGEDIEQLVFVKAGIFDDEVKVNLGSGLITGTDNITSVTAADSYRIVAHIDRIAESDGANTLKLKPFNDTASLEATENRVILQSSIETQAQMNKIYRQNAQYGVVVDFGQRAVDQVVHLYTYFIDVQIFKKLWAAASSKASLGVIDLSAFSIDNFKTSKNDFLANGVRALTSALLNKTGSPATALAVDTIAANLLATDNENMVLVPAFSEVRDGLIGTYMNIPVIRNSYLNGKAGTSGIIVAAHKSRDAQVGAVAYGDYLPPYSTIPAVNPNNPGELSQALFSQTACKEVVPEFCEYCTVKSYNTVSLT